MMGATETRTKRGRSLVWLLHLLPVLVLAACFAYGTTVYPSLPDTIPTHWGPNGSPDAWSPKTFGTAYFPLLVAAGVSVLLALVTAALPKMVVPDQEPSAWELHRQEGLIRGTIAALGCTSFLIAVLSGFFTVAGWANPDRVPLWPALLLTALILGAIPVSYASSSRWARRTALGQGIKPTALEENEDKLWIVGILYNNPADARVLVPKRPGTGIGLTVNVGSPKGRAISIVFTILFVVVPLVLGVIATL
ncbi:DUF1648 domain-containing protein [Paenarthrobacter sp. NPDC089675]|uniref:DUF1648 domain-containing protein n=1 Tax=Paenarthrobacter sp. NPDC089675 TaxID=3364376 RepID=UPI00382887BE